MLTQTAELTSANRKEMSMERNLNLMLLKALEGSVVNLFGEGRVSSRPRSSVKS